MASSVFKVVSVEISVFELVLVDFPVFEMVQVEFTKDGSCIAAAGMPSTVCYHYDYGQCCSCENNDCATRTMYHQICF